MVRQPCASQSRLCRGLGFEITVGEEALNAEEFLEGPGESRRIRVGGKPLETWLSATTGQRRC
ncbi:MAG: DUF2703 domain-containing protein [Marinobacter sp.]|nr:DUF2703 domain-containing protein [Marinobacter sp.]